MTDIKFKPHGYYDHLPNLHPQEGEQFFNLYSDRGLDEEIGDNAIALLLEPRAIDPYQYEAVLKKRDKFKYIFTHDDKILRLPNAFYFNWGVVWCFSDEEKTKGISLISSFKEMCPLHRKRKELAKFYQGSEKVDVYGDFMGTCEDKTKWVSTHDAHAPYKFAIVIENDISPLWFTEKILNCFANKTVPIYLGASKVGNWFDKEGIIQVNSIDEIKQIVETIDIDSEYENRLEAIETNYKRVKPWETDWRKRLIKYVERLEGEYK